MKNIISIIILFSCLWIIACQSHKPSGISSEIPENGGFTIEELQAKALTDSTFRESKLYSKYMERACIEQSKKSMQLNDKGELLKEFEISLKSLKESTDKLKGNQALSKNKEYITLIQLKADNVREYQQLLKKLALNTAEKEQFLRLCKM